MHQTIAKVTEDIEAMRFNTAISALMELTNAAYKWPQMPRAAAEAFVLLLAPLAPHLAEELWQRLGPRESLAYHAWPVADAALLKADVLEIPVQVNGKVRGKISVPAEAQEAEVIEIAKADPNVGKHLAGQTREARDLRARPHRELRRRRLTPLAMPKRVVVITCWGSHGDLFPYIGLALALQARGLEAVVATQPGLSRHHRARRHRVRGSRSR